MTSRECQWFLGCKRPPAALVAHPRGPVPTCAACIDRMGLRNKVIAAILEPIDGGDPIVVSLSDQPPAHAAEHFFHGACICPCPACTRSVGLDGVVCLCSDCPPSACGAKAATA